NDFYDNGREMEIPFGESTVYGVQWTSRDRDPFQYFAGVAVDQKQLHLVEIFSPRKDDKLFEYIFKAMKEGELK
ncbi:MAG: hypothetical protein GY786_18105, partial [Proteobacteria bacterium]|nr:hypothetical protein [Pseudomonadota bacterium]